MAYSGYAAPGGAVYEIANPRMPYSGPVRGPLIHGSMIFVRGHIQQGCSRMVINLEAANGDIALHINPRFDQGAIVRNTSHGSWGAEERDGGMPLQQGGQFECILLVQEGHYKIAFNGQHFTDYHHRMPKESVTLLKVDGDLHLTNITFQGVPQGPFTVDLPDGHMQHKNCVVIKGIPKDGAERFSVNLQCDHEAHDIPFHFDARLAYGNDNKVIVGNNKEGGSWCSEERCNDCPFEAGEPFTMKIKCGKAAYKVKVNDQKIMRFPYRVDKECVHTLMIDGDLILESVKA